MPEVNPTKTCCRCKVPKALGAFCKCQSAKDGLYWACKTCETDRHHRWNVTEAGKAVYRRAREKHLKNAPPCRLPSCGKPAWARGFCSTHLQKARETQTIPAPKCRVEGCPKGRHSKGLCVKHWKQWFHAVEKCDRSQLPAESPKPCSFEGCSWTVAGRDLCKRHHAQLMAGQPLKPIRRSKKLCRLSPEVQELIRKDAGLEMLSGKSIFLSGSSRQSGEPGLYPSIDTVKGGRKRRVRVHRLVMEAKLGRPLLPDEIVHHEDLDPLNCHPKNLELFPNQSEHLRHHVALRASHDLPPKAF